MKKDCIINGQKNNGFTLIELLIVVALLAISAGVTGDILISLVRSFNRATIYNEIEQQANFVTVKLEKELLNGKDLKVYGAVNNQIDFDYTDPQTGEITRIGYLVNPNDTMYRQRGVSPGFPASGPYNVLLDTNNITGVKVSCPASSGKCFTVSTGTPQIITYELQFEHAGSMPLGTSKGKVIVNKTVVLRNTY